MTYDEYFQPKIRLGWDQKDVQRAWNSRIRCNKCRLCEDPSTGFIRVSSRGSVAPKILIVGEGPGNEESKLGQAFVGPAARHGEEIMTKLGIHQEYIRYTNTTRCFPHDNSLKPRRPDYDKETSHCIEYLWDEIELLKPDVIIALGAYAAQVLVGKPLKKSRISITKVNGIPFQIGIRGKEYTIIPCVHFSANLRASGKYSKDINSALIAAWDIVNGKEAPVKTHVLNNTNDACSYLLTILDLFIRGEIDCIAYDLEYATLIESNEMSRQEANRLSTLDVHNPDCKLAAASFALSSSEGYCIPLYCEGSKVEQKRVQEMMAVVLKEIPVVSHNFLKAEGSWTWAKIGVKPKLHFDTMLASYVLHMKTISHGLKSLCRRFLNWPDWSRRLEGELEKLPADRKTYANIPIEELGVYSAIDPAATWGLYEKFREMVVKEGVERPLDLLHRASEAFLDMERRGAFIDTDRLGLLKDEYPAVLKEALLELRDYPQVKELEKEIGGDYNPNSPVQVAEVLYQKFGCPVPNDNEIIPIPVEVKEGDTFIPWSSTVVPKSVWLGDLVSEGGVKERAKVAGVERGTMKFKLPLRNAYAKPVQVLPKAPSTAEKVIFAIMDHYERRQDNQRSVDVCNFLLSQRKYKKISKIVNSYISSIPSYLVPNTNQLVFNYLLHGTATGRFTTKDFSLQTIPWHGDIRPLFVSKWMGEGGLIVSMDQSQVEMRVMAAMSGDERMIELYLKCGECGRIGGVEEGGRCTCGGKQGGDIHRSVASSIYQIPEKEVSKDQRRFAKTCGFGLIYGRGPHSMAAETQSSLKESEEVINSFFERFPKIKVFIEGKHEEFRNKGYIRTPMGRKLFPEGHDATEAWMQARGERESQNYPIQSVASDITLEGLLIAKQDLINKGLRSVPWEFTHDSIEFDVYPGELTDVIEIGMISMQQGVRSLIPWMTVPLLVDAEFGVRWDCGLEIEEMDGDQIRVSGKKSYFDETVEHMKKAYLIETEIIKEEDRPESDQRVLRRSFTMDHSTEWVEAIIRIK